MTVSVKNKEINAIVSDLNQTFYRIPPEQEKVVWGDMRRNLAMNALARRGIADPSETLINDTIETLVEQAQIIGWKRSFMALGGNEADYFKIKSEVKIAEHLSYDPKLVEVLNLLTEHLPVHIFTGSQRDLAFKSLEILVGKQNKQRFEQRLLAIDDMRQASKPDLEAYQEMLERFHLEPEKTALIDDSLPEVEMAASLGMITFWIKNSHEGNGFSPHILINSFADLPKHLHVE